jgi:hypothetical protein
MIFKKSSATSRTVERFARRQLPSRSGFPDRFVSGFNAMGRLFAVKIHAAGESPFGLSSARRIFRRHAPRDGQSARCGDATVPPSFTVRLAAMGSGLNAPTAFNKAKSFAAST